MNVLVHHLSFLFLFIDDFLKFTNFFIFVCDFVIGVGQLVDILGLDCKNSLSLALEHFVFGFELTFQIVLLKSELFYLLGVGPVYEIHVLIVVVSVFLSRKFF